VSEALGRVAVLGTGIMGAPMARNIAAHGIEVTVWNRTAEKARALAGERIDVADSPPAAVDGADAMVTVLTAGDAVAAVVEEGEALAALPRDAVWMQSSTVGIEATERFVRLAADAGVAFVDAPVLGTKAPAEAGELLVLASGPTDALERVRPIFDAVGGRTVELGEAGAGSRMKLVANEWVLALTTALAETLALADALGIDGERFLEVISGGPVDAGYAQIKGKMMVDREYEPSFPLALARKDVDLVLQAATAEGLELALAETVRGQFAAAEAAGHGDEDMAAVREAMRR
jgi:3-hydroxyisobutyrate dehydrogenase